MKKPDLASQGLFDSHRSLLRAQGVCVQIEDISEELLWLRVRTRPDLVSVLSTGEVRKLVEGVFAPLPYQVFITLVQTNQQDDFTPLEA